MLVLSIRGLSKTYPNGVRALSDVTLTIPTGMFGLLGPNGAGKSTLMRTIATLQEADSGSATIGPFNNGSTTGTIDVLRQKDEVRKILGYLPQEFGVYPRISAEAMLSHLAALKGFGHARERKEVVEALLHRVNLYVAGRQRRSEPVEKLTTKPSAASESRTVSTSFLRAPVKALATSPVVGSGSVWGGSCNRGWFQQFSKR